MARPSNMNWLFDMAELFKGSTATIPNGYRNQVLAVKQLLQNDETGIISSLLDFGISSSADVNFSVEVQNENLGKILNDWLSDINGSLLGKIPIGIEALAKEYYRERWKGSSMLVLRTIWGTVDGMKLPTKMWFVDGEDIDVSSDAKVVILGDQKYSIITDPENKKKNIQLPASDNEKIFVQKPYSSWGTDFPVPFLIQRGLYKNALILQNLIKKGEVVVAKALEYLMLVKKGTEALAKENRSEFIYSDEDLKAVKKQLGMLTEGRASGNGVPSYITNFDTEIEHLIPDYERILKPALFVLAERRILSGIGMVDIVESTSSSRREGSLNPKPFIGELNSGVNDFGALLKDIILTIIMENKPTHPKYFSSKNTLDVRHSPVKAFMTDDFKTMLRSVYDRGGLSKQTFVETVGETSYNEEKLRRKREKSDGDEKTFYPPVIQNMEQHENDPDGKKEDETKIENEEKDASPDKKGPEAKNYTNSTITKNKDLPTDIKVLSSAAQTIWRASFNSIIEDSNSVESATKIAWTNVKMKYKKNEEGKWVTKTKSELETSFENANIVDLERIQKLALLGKQTKMVDIFLKANLEENETT